MNVVNKSDRNQKNFNRSSRGAFAIMKRFPISRSESRIKIVIIMDLIKYVRQQGWT